MVSNTGGKMKVILTAPIMDELANPEKYMDEMSLPRAASTTHTRSNAYASRRSYHVHELDQVREEQRTNLSLGNSEIIEKIERIEKVTCNHRDFYIATVDCGTYFERGGSVVDAEVSLTESMRSFIDQLSERGSEMAWVEKCALVETEAEIPATWFESDPTMWTARTSDESKKDSLVYFAWGNSAIVGSPSQEDLTSIHYAFVDSLAIWTDMERISQRASKIVHDIVHPEKKQDEAKILKNSIDSLEELSIEVVYHHLLLNDIYLRIPGLRRIAALKLLESWSYQFSADRLVELVDKAESVSNQRKHRIERRSQQFVEWALFALAVAGLMQIMLGIFSASFIGYDAETPVETGPIRVLEVLREFDFAFILLFSVVIIGVVIWLPRAIRWFSNRARRARQNLTGRKAK